MARKKHMAVFNIATGYKTVLRPLGTQGTILEIQYHVPHNAFYGRDSYGYWICIEHTTINRKYNKFKIVRFDSACNKWLECYETGTTTVQMIEKFCDEKPEYYSLPVFENDCNIKNTFNKSSMRVAYHFNGTMKKGNQADLERRENAVGFIKPHFAETTFSNLDYDKKD